MIAVVTAVNIWGTRKSSDLQNWTTLIKGGLVVILSAVLLSLGHHAADLRPALGPAQHGFSLFSNFALAMIAVLWAYEGWQFGTYNAGEVIAPQKSFPRAFLLGSLILIVLYLFAVIAYMIALGPAAASVSDAIAADAVRLVLGRWAGKIIAFTILISTFSATNSVILTAPRVFYAMANDRLFFQNFCSVHKRYQTPAIAILALGAWSAMLASLGGFAELAAGAIFIGWIFYGLAAAAIFPIRRASKNATLPYRVPGYPWTPGIFVLVAAAIVGNSIYVAVRDPGQFKSLVVAIVLFLLGTPAYFLWTMSRRRSTP